MPYIYDTLENMKMMTEYYHDKSALLSLFYFKPVTDCIHLCLENRLISN